MLVRKNIRVICPSGSFNKSNLKDVKKVKEKLQNMGFQVTFGKNAFKYDSDFKCASIKERVDDLHNAFLDKDVDIILCGKGGFNVNQILPYIDFDCLKKNPKVICGFSDNTALLIAIYMKCNLITYLGPNYINLVDDKTLKYFIDCIYNDNYMGMLQDILAEISQITQESVGLAVLEGDKIISILEIDVPRPMKMNDVPGRFFQGNKGNYGKCITAFRDPEFINHYLDTHHFEKTYPAVLTEKEELLEEYAKIREQGYSTSIDELGIDVVGTGVPLFGKNGKIKGCIAIAFFRTDDWKKRMLSHKDLLLSYQQRIEKYLP